MKKMLVLISLPVILLLALAACGGGGSSDDGFDTGRVIAVFTREDGSGTRDAFVSITGVGDNMYAEAVVENSTAGIRTNVVNNPYAIGYVSVGSLNDTVKALSVNGVFPSDENIRNGTYGLRRPFTIVYNADTAGHELAQDFIAFMLSAEGQDVAATGWTRINVNAPAYTTRGLTGTLRVGGSTSVEPLMQRMKEAYEAHNPGVTIEISGGGSGTGINEATSGVIDIGMSSRALRDTEKAALTDLDIALDGVAVIVNPDNPLTDITLDQIKAIFTGDVTRWSGLN